MAHVDGIVGGATVADAKGFSAEYCGGGGTEVACIMCVYNYRDGHTENYVLIFHSTHSVSEIVKVLPGVHYNVYHISFWCVHSKACLYLGLDWLICCLDKLWPL